MNPWENAFVRWMLLLPAHEDEHLTQTLETNYEKSIEYDYFLKNISEKMKAC